MEVNTDDLLAIIGRQQVQIITLQRVNTSLVQAMNERAKESPAGEGTADEQPE